MFARQNQYPAFFFRRIKNSSLPLLMNLTATYERLALALGTTTEDMVRNATFLPLQRIQLSSVQQHRSPHHVADV